MLDTKKETKAKVAKPKSPAKPKAAKSAAKPKATSAPKAPEVKAPALEKKAKKTRAYSRKPKGSFGDLLKIQSQYEEARKGAKTELKKKFDSLIKESESIKAQYKGLFNENIESAPKTRGRTANKIAGKTPGLKPFSLGEIEEFVEQKKEGKTVKIKGRRPKSIARMEDAYRHSEDAEDILRMLNQ